MRNPIERYGRMLSLQDLMRRGEMNQLRLDEAQRVQRERRSVADIFRRHRTPEGDRDTTKTLDEIYQVNPETALKLEQEWREAERERLQAQKAALEFAGERAQQLGSLAESITDQPTYQWAISEALRRDLIAAETAAQLPREWNENTRKLTRQLAQQSMSANEQIQRRLQQAEHEAKLPGIQAETAGKQFKLFGQLAPGAAQSAYGFSELRKRVLPDNLRFAAPATPGGGAVERAQEMGMTPAEQASAEDRRKRTAQTKHYQEERIQLSRESEKKSEAEKRKTAAAKAAEKRTKRLEDIRQEELRLEKQQGLLDEERTRLGDILSRGGKKEWGQVVEKGKPRDISQEEAQDLQTKFQAVSERWQRILDRKEELKNERQALRGRPVPTPKRSKVGTPSRKPRKVNPITGRTIGAPTYTEEELIRSVKRRGLPQANIERALAEGRRQGVIR
jgi:hypothetical protein